jgi:hypothetical protein
MDQDFEQDRAIAQAVSHWLSTVAAWVSSRVWSSGICGGQSGAGAGTIGQKWPQFKGLSLTPLAIKKRYFELIWNDEGRIKCFESHREGNRYSPYLMI